MRKTSAKQTRTSYSGMGSGRVGFEPCYGYDEVWQFGAGLHCHDFYELYIHFHGLKYYCIDTKVYEIVPYQLMVVPPFTMHGHIGTEPPRDYERAFLYITPSMLKDAGASIIDLDSFLSKCAALGQHQYLMSEDSALTCKRLIREMISAIDDPSAIGRFANYSRMLSFLQLVCQTVQRSNKESEPVVVNQAMQEVLLYINTHFAQPLRLETLARQFGVSVSYLSHEFVKYTGRSVYDYILYRRVLQAKEMINSGASFSEIAYQSGFSDYSSFLRTFKKMTGMSPNAWRRAARGVELIDAPLDPKDIQDFV